MGMLEQLYADVIFGITASLVFAWVVLTLMTHNIMVSSICTVVIAGIICSVLFMLTAFTDIAIGMNEAIITVVLVGLSVDYVVHLGHAYNESGGATRLDKTKEAYTQLGVSIVSGALTTIMAGVFLFACVFTFFFDFGKFITFTIICSFLSSMILLAALLVTFGPEGDFGDLPPIFWCRKPKKKSGAWTSTWKRQP